MTPAPSLTPCTVDTCDAPTRTRGLCNKHYLSARRKGELKPIAKKDPQQRFWEKVDKSGDCWEWTASKYRDGYGVFWLDGRNRYAHRLSWELDNGPTPDGMQIDHMCHNRACVNPAHLRVVTHGENQQNRPGAYRNSKTGVRGVCWHKASSKWVARGMLNGKYYHLGLFRDLADAEKAAVAWRIKHMPYSVKDQAKEDA